MFSNLLQLWRGKDFLNEVLKDFEGMLNNAENMFIPVVQKLVHDQDTPNLKEKIYAIDKKINEEQRNIRKRVTAHLALQPLIDTSTCLLLMSVVKDAERLGDFCKNLFEVTAFLNKPIDKAKHKSLFHNIEKDITNLFQQAKMAFIESDTDEAKESWEQKKIIVNRCEIIIEKLAKSDLPANEVVCFVLMARYYKRIAAHLTNISTAFILPLTDIDYFDERMLEE